jgi:hypothetical protein
MSKVVLALIAASLLGVVAAPAAAGHANGERDEIDLRLVPESAWSRDASAPVAADVGWLSSDGPPSRRRAVLYSLILPGLGDYYAGRKDRARYFFISEAAIWVSFAVFRIQGFQDERAYQNFAVEFAGVSRTDHSDDFYAEIRDWDSSAEYESAVKAGGRLDLFPDVSNEALDAYFVDMRLSDFEPWEWESVERRLQYAELRSASKRSYRRATYSVAAAGVNRVVSAIFAYHAAKTAGGNQSLGRYHLDFSPPPGHATAYDATVSIVRTF